MKYSINYQFKPKNSFRPHDDGDLVPFKIDDQTKFILLPNVGDYVHIGATQQKTNSKFGVVVSKLFNYQEISSGEVICEINIVIEETNEDLRKLVKA